MSDASANPTANPAASPVEAFAQSKPPAFQSASVTFVKEDKLVFAAAGDNLRLKALENGIDLYTLKGGESFCSHRRGKSQAEEALRQLPLSLPSFDSRPCFGQHQTLAL
jgi:hypothetical protein